MACSQAQVTFCVAVVAILTIGCLDPTQAAYSNTYNQQQQNSRNGAAGYYGRNNYRKPQYRSAYARGYYGSGKYRQAAVTGGPATAAASGTLGTAGTGGPGTGGPGTGGGSGVTTAYNPLALPPLPQFGATCPQCCYYRLVEICYYRRCEYNCGGEKWVNFILRLRLLNARKWKWPQFGPELRLPGFVTLTTKQWAPPWPTTAAFPGSNSTGGAFGTGGVAGTGGGGAAVTAPGGAATRRYPTNGGGKTRQRRSYG